MEHRGRWPIAGHDRRVSVLDNSEGAGRLLQFADPERHVVAGWNCDGRF